MGVMKMGKKERRRMRRRKEKVRRAGLTLVVLLVLIFTLAGMTEVGSGVEMTGNEAETAVTTECMVTAPPAFAEPLVAAQEAETFEEGEDTEETEKIEAALVEQGYFRDDVPLSYELQDYLHTACQEAGVPYALALAVIQKETQFQNRTGDDGASKGYMQVQRRWHYDRMKRLGVEDLMEPFGNFRVGCDFLAELLGKYEIQVALTAYNSGKPGYNDYSYEVMDYFEAWKELVGDEVSGIKG